jgi:anti-sigma factor ChrR (cupin superfamily)
MRTSKPQSRCPSTAQLLAVLTGKQAAPRTAPRLAAHLAQCPPCQAEADAIEEFLQRDLAAEVAAAYRGVTVLRPPPGERGGSPGGGGWP